MISITLSRKFAYKTLAGVTKNNSGSPLGTCQVAVFKQDGATPPAYTYVVKTTSDGSGNYSVSLLDADAQHMVYAIKPGAPNVFDATDNVLAGT